MAKVIDKGVWLVFALSEPEDKCIRRYQERFGQEPRYCITDKKWRWLGPVPEKERA